MSKKTKILLLGDHPMAPSGVGTQLRYICETLLSVPANINLFVLAAQ